MMFATLLVLGWLGQPPIPPPAPPGTVPGAPATTPAMPAAPAPPAVPTPPATAPAPPAPPAAAAPVPPSAPAAPAAAPAPPEVPTTPPAPTAPAAPAAPATATPPKFIFTLGQKCEGIGPCTHHAAKVEEGKAEVTAEDNLVKVVLTGAAGANVFLGVESAATQSIQVIQEFEITCSDESIREVVLTLESNLLGIIRSKHKGSASVQLASATVAQVGASTGLMSVSYPTYGVCGAQGYKYETPLDPVKVGPVPLGHYVLQANFIIQATAGGLLDGHATAIFVPASEALDPWEREHDPFAGDKHDDYGFTLTLKADSPPGHTPVAKRKPSKKVTARPANRLTRR
jgi:hypothetical protein